MTRDETKNLIRAICALYPNWKPGNISETVDVWAVMLDDIPYSHAQKALKVFSRTDKSGFAPSIGQLINIMKPPAENALMAWGRVKRALRNSKYNADLEYSQLTDDIKRALGGPGQLKAWSMLSEVELETVTQSQFIKAYNMEISRPIKTQVPESMMIEQKETTMIAPKTEAPADLIERVQQAKESGKSIHEMYEDDVKEIQERWRAIKDGEKNEG